MSSYSLPDIASTYSNTDLLPYRKWAEFWTYQQLLGSLEEMSVLDAGCGTGIISRLMVAMGAKAVSAIDCSEAMINQAIESNQSFPNINYSLQPVENYRTSEPHDLIVSSFLFNEAKSTQHLKEICLSLYSNLKDGGKLTVMMDMPDRNYDIDYSHYGFIIENHDHRMVDGESFKLTISSGDEQISLNLYNYSPETVERTLRKVGFQQVKFHSSLVSEEGIESMPEGYWNTYICRPCIIFISAVRTESTHSRSERTIP